MKKFDLGEMILKMIPVFVLMVSALWFVADIEKRLTLQEAHLSTISDKLSIYNEFNKNSTAQLKSFISNELAQIQAEINQLENRSYTSRKS